MTQLLNLKTAVIKERYSAQSLQKDTRRPTRYMCANCPYARVNTACNTHQLLYKYCSVLPATTLKSYNFGKGSLGLRIPSMPPDLSVQTIYSGLTHAKHTCIWSSHSPCPCVTASCRARVVKHCVTMSQLNIIRLNFIQSCLLQHSSCHIASQLLCLCPACNERQLTSSSHGTR